MPKSLLNKQAGVALILVLWVIALLALIAGSFALTMRRDTSIASALISNAKAQAWAEAGLHYAQFRLSDPDPKQRWQTNGTVYRMPQPWGELRIAIYAEAGKVDLNTSNEAQLSALLGAFVDDERQRQHLVEAIMDWRDADDEPRPNGAERAQYQQARLPQQPNNAAFQSLPEFQLVLGIDQALYEDLAPMITVYSGLEQVDLKQAAPRLQAILQQESADEGVNSGTSPQRPSQVSQSDSDTQYEEVNVTNDNVYTIVSEVQLDDAGRIGLKAVLRAQNDAAATAPFKILDWKINNQTLSLFADETADALMVTVEHEFTDDD